MKQIRKMPTENAIRKYWSESLWEIKGFDSADEFINKGTCFACGMDAGGIERAHIKAKCEGGSDTVENLHMLCHVCHKDSEFLSGDQYADWFHSRSVMDMLISAACRRGFNASSLFGGVK